MMPPSSSSKALPKKSAGKGGGALVPLAAKSRDVSLMSNQYKLKLSQNSVVYQYALSITPNEYLEASRVHEIIRKNRTNLERALGYYVPSGMTIYTLTELDESLSFATPVRGVHYHVSIDKSTETLVHMQENFSNENNEVAQMLINVILKQAFRETKYKQLGRSPRFFDDSKA